MESLGFVWLPEELHYEVLSFLPSKSVLKLSETSKKFHRMCRDGTLWKLLYVNQYIPGASQAFLAQFYPNSFDWKQMFQVRYSIEKRPPSKKSSKDEKDDKMDIEPTPSTNAEDPPTSVVSTDWKSYLKRGKDLARSETDSVSEYVRIVTVEKENYISAWWFLQQDLKQGKEIDQRQAGDLFYFWGRSLKDLNPAHSMDLLKQEEDMYRRALTFYPKDAYSLYSWAINLRYQMESCEMGDSSWFYEQSILKFKEAQNAGYEKKFCTWGRASLKLHYARRRFVNNNLEECTHYLQRAEKQLGKLKTMCGESDVLTLFAICFNWSCIYSLKFKMARALGQYFDFEKYSLQCKEHVQLCAQGNFKEYLTLDLLDLWYFEEFRAPAHANEWFYRIYNSAKPKKLTASY